MLRTLADAATVRDRARTDQLVQLAVDQIHISGVELQQAAQPGHVGDVDLQPLQSHFSAIQVGNAAVHGDGVTVIGQAQYQAALFVQAQALWGQGGE